MTRARTRRDAATNTDAQKTAVPWPADLPAAMDIVGPAPTRGEWQHPARGLWSWIGELPSGCVAVQCHGGQTEYVSYFMQPEKPTVETREAVKAFANSLTPTTHELTHIVCPCCREEIYWGDARRSDYFDKYGVCASCLLYCVDFKAGYVAQHVEVTRRADLAHTLIMPDAMLSAHSVALRDEYRKLLAALSDNGYTLPAAGANE